MIAGVDEAGRGSLVGPMVICFAVAPSPKTFEFVKKDSKQLSPSQRLALSKEIRGKASKIRLFFIEPEEIDRRNINEIELEKLEEFVKQERPKVIYIDLFEPTPKRITRMLSKYNVKIIAEHKADERYNIVSAASIIAKVERDRAIEKIAEKTGFFGSGYPSDERTVSFVSRNYEKMKPYIRKKWKTKIGTKTQKKIGDY